MLHDVGTWVSQWLSVLPLAQVMILGPWDRVPHWTPTGSLLLPLSVSLPLCVCVSCINKIFFKKKNNILDQIIKVKPPGLAKKKKNTKTVFYLPTQNHISLTSPNESSNKDLDGSTKRWGVWVQQGATTPECSLNKVLAAKQLLNVGNSREICES